MSTTGSELPPGDSIARTSSRRAGLSIQSLLLIMLLLVSLLSSVVVGLIGYLNGSDSLRDATFDRLIGVRDSRAREVTNLFDRIRNTLLLQSRSEETLDAIRDFTAAFEELQSVELTAERRPGSARTSAVRSADNGETPPGDATGRIIDPSSFMPSSPAESYLQLNYTITFSDFEDSVATDDAGDTSVWSEANARYHDQFRWMTELVDFEDVLLIDTKGNVVYVRVQGCRSWNEPAHLAILLQQSGSGLYGRPRHEHPRQRRVHRLRGVPAVSRRSRGMGGFPDRADGQAIGAIAVELSIDSINSVMTGGSEWAARRPNLTKAESSGTKAAIAQRIVNTGNALLLQPVTTGAVQHALNSETGTLIGHSYLGDEPLAASAPVQVDNLDWVIVAEIETDEAFAPVRKFTRNLVLSSTALVVVSLFSLILAQLIVRPLRRLKVAAGRVAAGEQGVQATRGEATSLRMSERNSTT